MDLKNIHIIFINILKTAGFTKTTAEKLPKYLEHNGSVKLIELCKTKNYTNQLDKLFDSSKMEYSIIYMDLLLNFFAFHFQVRPNGKNKSLYFKLISQAESICEMLSEYDNNFDNLVNKKFGLLNIDRIINDFNASEIEYQLNNHITLIIDEVNKFLVSMPEIIEYIPEKSENESNEFVYKNFFQKKSLISDDFDNIIEYFKF